MKEVDYEVCQCTTNQDLYDAISKNRAVIEISGQLKSTMLEDLSDQINKVTAKRHINKFGKLISGLGIVGVASAVFTPIAATAAGIALSHYVVTTILGGAIVGGSSLSGLKTEFDKYAFATFSEYSREHLFLVHKKYQPTVDKIKGYEQYIFLRPETVVCPKCKKKIKDLKEKKMKGNNPCICPNCRQSYIWTIADEQQSKKR